MNRYENAFLHHMRLSQIKQACEEAQTKIVVRLLDEAKTKEDAASILSEYEKRRTPQ